jgi:uncharacterized NAD(P)/FAD-binding protein YdhS
MGLSGTRTLVELIARLGQGPGRARPIEVAVFDRAGEFARGIPYGRRSDRRSMLIETLRETRCPEFSRWIAEHPAVLDALADSDDPDDRAWYARNAAALAAHAHDGLFLPRHVFGEFSARMLAAALEFGEQRGLVRVRRHVDEVLDLAPAGEEYELLTSGGTRCTSRRVLLAVGSVPRHDGLQATLGYRYVCDSDFCGSFALRDALDRFARESPVGEVRLAIIGAAASGLESLYCAMHHPPLSARIASVTTFSGSGVLAGGLRGSDDAPVSDYARLRTSAADYVRTAQRLLDAGRLHIVAARVQTVRAGQHGLCIEARRSLDGAPMTAGADLVINCSGAGRVHSTPSALLRNLAHKLTLRNDGRSFALRADHSLCDWPGVLVAGPLLNGGSAASDVESISAVFRVGRELGTRLAGMLATPAEVPARAREAG